MKPCQPARDDAAVPAPQLTLRFSPTELDGDLADETDASSVETEALIAIGTDRRVDASQLPDGVPNRGWWADSVWPNDGEQIGSALWLLEGAQADDASVARAEELLAEALSPMQAAGRIASFQSLLERTGQYLDIAPVLVLPDGSTASFGALRVN